jgi:hypothetical protein
MQFVHWFHRWFVFKSRGFVVALHGVFSFTEARGVDHGARFAGLVERGRDEGLAPEARVHAHQEDDVQLVHHVLANVERRGRVEHQARLAPAAPDQLGRAKARRAQAERRGKGSEVPKLGSAHARRASSRHATRGRKAALPRSLHAVSLPLRLVYLSVEGCLLGV